MTNIVIATLMLLAAGQNALSQVSPETERGARAVSSRQQTTMARGVGVDRGDMPGVRISSRLETRLDTRISKEKIITVGRSSGSTRLKDRPNQQRR